MGNEISKLEYTNPEQPEASYTSGQPLIPETPKRWCGKDVYLMSHPVQVYCTDEKDITLNPELNFPCSRRSILDRKVCAIGIKKEQNPFTNLLKSGEEKKDFNEVFKVLNTKKTFNTTFKGAFYCENESQDYFSDSKPIRFTNQDNNPLRNIIESISDKHNCGIGANFDQHWHMEIKHNLQPHEDALIYNSSVLPGSGNETGPIANCDFLLTYVRSVKDPALEKDKMTLYLAAKGLGNVVKNENLITTRAAPYIDNDPLGLLNSINQNYPYALRIVGINNKTKTGYSIKQTAEYSVNVEKHENKYIIKCFNSEDSDQILFEKTIETKKTTNVIKDSDDLESALASQILDEFIEKNHKKPATFKILHGYERSTDRITQQAPTQQTTTEDVEDFKRQILIGRISAFPKEAELEAYHYNKAADYTGIKDWREIISIEMKLSNKTIKNIDFSQQLKGKKIAFIFENITFENCLFHTDNNDNNEVIKHYQFINCRFIFDNEKHDYSVR